jgi:hypothetical protein
MTREENLLFGLYAWRTGLLTKEQLLAICKSLKPGADVDLGKSLSKRNIVDEEPAAALWALVRARIAKFGDALPVVGTIPMDEAVKNAIVGALIPPPESRPDEATIHFEPPAGA